MFEKTLQFSFVIYSITDPKKDSLELIRIAENCSPQAKAFMERFKENPHITGKNMKYCVMKSSETEEVHFMAGLKNLSTEKNSILVFPVFSRSYTPEIEFSNLKLFESLRSIVLALKLLINRPEGKNYLFLFREKKEMIHEYFSETIFSSFKNFCFHPLARSLIEEILKEKTDTISFFKVYDYDLYVKLHEIARENGIVLTEEKRKIFEARIPLETLFENEETEEKVKQDQLEFSSLEPRSTARKAEKFAKTITKKGEQK